LHERLLEKARVDPALPQRVPPRRPPVLETVTSVLELAGKPMRASEIHAAVAELLGQSISWSSVKAILSAHTIGCDRRFSRSRRGYYELTAERTRESRL
jgi:hypothetical protein